MTLDVQIAFPCPHLTLEERVQLGSDRRSLELRQPLNSGDFIQIMANNDLDLVVPSDGLFSAARLEGSVSGPFNIKKNFNQLLVRNGEKEVLATLTVGTRVPTISVVQQLQTAFQNAGLQVQPVSRNGYLSLFDLATLGPSSRLFVGGSAAPSLGFATQTGSKGKLLFPGWSFAEKTDLYNTVQINQFATVSTRFIRFNQIVQSTPFFRVTYVTVQQRCRRCRSYAIENDYRFDSAGNVLLVGNENLLNQAMLKLLTTRKGSNPFHEYYGTTLLDRIGSKSVTGAVSSIKEDVLSAVDTFKKLQTLQGRLQELTARERLAVVQSVTVTPSPQDPTVVLVEVTGSNASGQPINITTVYAAPGTAALVGTNGLSLGLQGFGLNAATTARDIFG